MTSTRRLFVGITGVFASRLGLCSRPLFPKLTLGSGVKFQSSRARSGVRAAPRHLSCRSWQSRNQQRWAPRPTRLQRTRPRRRSYWAAVKARDRSFDGTFYYSVATTGVCCRPSCAARLANRENVAFHATAGEAEAAGFRPASAASRINPRCTRGTQRRWPMPVAISRLRTRRPRSANSRNAPASVRFTFTASSKLSRA